MQLELCKICQTKLTGIIVDQLCDDCHEKIRQKKLRRGSFILAPLWLPIWIAGSLIGALWGVLLSGFKDGMRSVKEFCNAWNPK